MHTHTHSLADPDRGTMLLLFVEMSSPQSQALTETCVMKRDFRRKTNTEEARPCRGLAFNVICHEPRALSLGTEQKSPNHTCTTPGLVNATDFPDKNDIVVDAVWSKRAFLCSLCHLLTSLPHSQAHFRAQCEHGVHCIYSLYFFLPWTGPETKHYCDGRGRGAVLSPAFEWYVWEKSKSPW